MTKQRENEYVPNYAVPPGLTLDEVMGDRAILPLTLATRTGLEVETIHGILDGSKSITPKIAALFERELGVPTRIWLNLERRYQAALKSVPAPVIVR